MPREKRYASAAARQQAYRDRKRNELEAEGLPARDIDEEPARPVVADAEPDELVGAVTLEAYVAQIRKEASDYADSIGEDDAPYTMWEGVVIVNRKRDRVARAAKYARWRYQGVLDGEVGSL